MELQLQDVRKQYGEKCAVGGVSADLVPGVYGLLGVNGAGKTTLMRMICGVLKPTSGSISLNGKTIQYGAVAHDRGNCSEGRCTDCRAAFRRFIFVPFW